ncbi:MAG: hypothetical protein Sapg2KO_39390 [Saprospiraceae bacterium]
MLKNKCKAIQPFFKSQKLPAMKYKILTWIFALAFIGLGCEDSLKLEEDVRISEEEIEVLEDCQNNPIRTQKQIEANLIGNWKLVGYACGNCIDGKSPRASITFRAEEGRIQYDDGFEQIDAEFSWRIEASNNIFGEPTLALKTEPILPGLFAEVFCQDYMAYNNTPVDGPLLIYAKQ